MKSYKIRITPNAHNDMENIWLDVLNASKDYDTADKYVNDFMNEIISKKKAPKTGTPVYHRGLFSGFYFIIFKAYLAFYRINYEYMEVIRILPSKSDYLQTLFGANESI